MPACRRRLTTLAIALGVLLAGCTEAAAPGGVPPAPDATPRPVPSPTADGEPPLDARGVACGGSLPSARGPAGDGARKRDLVRVEGLPAAATVIGESAALALALLGDAPPCGGRLVVARADDPAGRTLAAAAAVLRDEPLLLLPGDAVGWVAVPAAARALIVRRLAALDVDEVSAFGGPPDWLAAEVDRAVDLAGPAGPSDDPVAALLLLDDDPSAATTVVLVDTGDVAAQADVVAHVRHGVRPVVVDLDAGDGQDLAGLVAALTALDPAPAVRWAAGAPETARRWAATLATVSVPDGQRAPARWTPPAPSGVLTELWLGDVRAPGGALAVAVTAARRGAPAVAVDGGDLRSGTARTGRLRALGGTLAPGAAVLLVGGAAPDAGWQLDTVLQGTPLPGGGFLPLEDRRIVALYGSHGAPTLGILGEQDVEATLTRARELAAGYDDAVDGRTVVAGLDVIATVASAFPEPTGDYSRRVPLARLRPLVDRAGEEGMAVLLDLQPGRTDFLTQAQEYVELLREPHVHLALDPEWRIGPTERHLQRIGSVEAAEVQEVADWLAALVRTERLPQKILMLHQFTLDMLPERDTIDVPPELVGVVHVDGQGPLATKERTYAVMTGGAEERWQWGWKNFTRIDVPLATPQRTLDRSPVPVIITYQ